MIELFKHPSYQALADKYRVYKELYEGDHSVLSGADYLWPHELEMVNGSIGGDGLKLRAIRVKRSRYLNLIEPIVSRWLSFLFRRETNIPDSLKSLLGKEFFDIDGKGSSLESFIREKIGRDYVLYGKSTVLVETSPFKAATLADAKILGARPFLEILSPLEIVDWQMTDDVSRIGQFKFLRTEFDLVEPRSSYTDKPTKARYSKGFIYDGANEIQRLFKLSRSESGSGEWQQVGDDLVIPNKRLPIAQVESDSFVKDASEMQLMVFNTMSAESSALNGQAFQRIFISGQMSKDQKLAMNEYLVNFLPENSNVQTVEPFNAAPLQQARDAFIEMTFKVAFNQLNSLAADSKASPGAETRREMKDEFVALVQTSLTEIEDLVNRAMDDYVYKKNGGTLDERITFDKKVTEDDIDREIAIWQAHIDDFKRIPTLHKGIITKHAKYFGLPDEERIQEEIQSATFEQGTQQQEAQRSDTLRGLALGGI